MRSNTRGFGAYLGLAIGIFGATIGIVLLAPEVARGLSGDGEGFQWLYLHPTIFLAVGVSAIGSTKSCWAILRPSGESEAHFRRWFGLQRDDQTFHAGEVRVVSLHTDLRISRSKNGTNRSLVSHLSLGLQNGGEVLIGVNRRGGFRRREQPLLSEAEQIAEFLGVPLERTGYGAPETWGPMPAGVAGPPEPWEDPHASQGR